MDIEEACRARATEDGGAVEDLRYCHIASLFQFPCAMMWSRGTLLLKAAMAPEHLNVWKVYPWLGKPMLETTVARASLTGVSVTWL